MIYIVITTIMEGSEGHTMTVFRRTRRGFQGWPPEIRIVVRDSVNLQPRREMRLIPSSRNRRASEFDTIESCAGVAGADGAEGRPPSPSRRERTAGGDRGQEICVPGRQRRAKGRGRVISWIFLC